MDLCCGHLKSNLSPNNALDVLLSAHQANKEGLFRAASKFVHENKGQLAKTSAWKEMKKTNPTMIVNILSTVFDVWFINVGLNSGNTLISRAKPVPINGSSRFHEFFHMYIAKATGSM